MIDAGVRISAPALRPRTIAFVFRDLAAAFGGRYCRRTTAFR